MYVIKILKIFLLLFGHMLHVVLQAIASCLLDVQQEVYEA
jgi:hypothetical protein